MKTLVKMAGVVVLGLSALMVSGCNIQWTSSGTLGVEMSERPTVACQPTYVRPACEPVVIEHYRPIEVRPVECRPMIEIRPIVVDHCRPVKAVSRWLRK